MQPEDQPTVKRLGGKAQAAGDSSQALDAAELRQLALECGADDAGLVEISRPASTRSVMSSFATSPGPKRW